MSRNRLPDSLRPTEGEVLPQEPLEKLIARIILRKGAVVPQHSHENEQITYILEGALRFTMGDGRVITVGAGQLLVIPSNMPHSAVAVEDTVDLDVFTPPRADWIAGTDAYLRK